MKIVCFGDSLTAGGGEQGRFSDILQERFPGHEFVNQGAGGDSFVTARARLPAVLEAKPQVVLLELGAVDWWQAERPPAAWAADLEDFIVQFKQAGATPVVLGVFDRYRDAGGNLVEKTFGADERSRAYRELERAVAAKHGCPYVGNIQQDIVGRRTCWLDSNHPNEFGNRHVADQLEPVLGALLGTAPQAVRKPNLATLRDFWLEAVALAPAHLAVVDGARRLTYAAAASLVERLAAGIAQATKGAAAPKVAVFLPNCLEYYLLYWAVLRLNGAIVPLNTWLKADNLEAVFRTVQPDLLVVHSVNDREVLKAATVARPRAVYALKGDRQYPAFSRLLETTGEAPLPPIAPTDLAIVMHTSGTTAAPKGAMMRHEDLVFNVMTTINAHQFRPSDVHLVVNPMFHCTALYSSLPTAAYQQATCVITAHTTGEELLALVEAEGITTFLSIPAIFQRVVSVPDPTAFNCKSLRLMAYAGAVMPVSTIRRLQLYFPEVELHNFFGLTETISMTHVLPGAEAEARPDSIGRLLPFVAALIVNEQLEPLPPGAVGELLFARENVIPGYYRDPQRLAEALCTAHGRAWFRTGDLASVDAEGYFFIKGRAKDMIIVGGENVYAAEVEAVLMTHDLVKEAAVKGVAASGVRAVLGEMIRAYVVPRDRGLTEMDLRRHCHARLASFKIPHEIRFVADLPRNPSGKVLKNELPD